jgi:hypothetical protein
LNDQLLDQMFSDAVAQSQAPPSDVALKTVSELAKIQLEIEDEIAGLNAALENANDRLTQVKTKDLPDAMIALGCKAYTLVDGSTIKIEPKYGASISDERREPAHAWLRANKHGDLIKNVVTISLGKGEDEKAAKIVAWLKKKEIDHEQKEAVHPMTLKAFVREQLEASKTIPMDLFGAHVVDVAKIEMKKEKKKKA